MTDPRFVTTLFVPRGSLRPDARMTWPGDIIEYAGDRPPILYPPPVDSEPDVSELLTYNREPFVI